MTATAVTGVAVGQAPRLTNGQVTTQPGAGLLDVGVELPELHPTAEHAQDPGRLGPVEPVVDGQLQRLGVLGRQGRPDGRRQSIEHLRVR